MAASGASFSKRMMNSTPPTANIEIRNGPDYKSKLIPQHSSPSSVRHLHHRHQQQQSFNQRLKQQRNNSVDNNKTANTPKQRKKQSAPNPAPFLSFQVERENCAVYVGNIPPDERSPSPICENKPGPGDANQLTDDEYLSACSVELKAYLRDRINAAFKVPIEEIGIRTCRLFSVVTNVYSKNDTDNNSDADNDSSETVNSNIRKQPKRRLHRAACVEFKDPIIAEHCLNLKFTSFRFNGHHHRYNLRIRRWTSQPSPPPEKSKSLSPSVWSPKQTLPPPPSKSTSSEISNLKRQKLPPPPPPRPNTVSPNSINRKQLPRRQQLSLSTTINERPNSPMTSPTNTNLGYTMEVPDGRSSPSFSSCLVHVGNMPAEATSDELREFFLDRMSKAFHGVTPPEIIRIGIRHSGVATDYGSNSSIASQPRIDACVEFQEPRVAHRATLLRNRRWYAKDDESHNDEEGAENKDDDTSNSNYSDEKKRRNSMPVLEIELFDPTKYDTSDFFFVNESNSSARKAIKNTILGSAFYQENEYEEDGIDYGMYRTSPKPSPKSSPSQFKQIVDEARRSGFLVCSNPDKIPKCDHLFTTLPQSGEGTHCLEVKKGRMCHGYAFLGKSCRHIHTQRKSKKLCNPECPFVHIDSFDQLEDPHDILSLLYYVENNDEVTFSSGTGCTPQDYLLQQREWQPRVKKKNSTTESTPPNQQTNSLSHSKEELREMRLSLREIRRQLSTTQQQLSISEHARRTLLNEQTSNGDEKDAAILSLKDEVSRLRNDLQETNLKLKSSTLAAENDRRDYEFLQEKYQHYVSREGKAGISTELLESEIIKLREELEKSQTDCQALKQQQLKQRQPNRSPTSDFENSWPETNQLDTFLERSTHSLMQMMDKNTDSQLQLDLSPKPRLLDIPSDSESSLHVPYKAVIDCDPIQSLGLASPTSPTATTTKKRTKQDRKALRSEIACLVSCYGHQVFVNRSNGPTTVTRFLKLPVSCYEGRDIDVALVLTLPKDYPWNGIIEINSDPHYILGTGDQHRKLVSESIKGLLNVCRWEAKACQGKPNVLMSIMKAAERWVMNDWKIIQQKK